MKQSNKTKARLLANIPFLIGLILLMVVMFMYSHYIFPAFLLMGVLALITSAISLKIGVRLPSGTPKQKWLVFLFDCCLWILAIGVMYYTLFR